MTHFSEPPQSREIQCKNKILGVKVIRFVIRSVSHSRVSDARILSKRYDGMKISRMTHGAWYSTVKKALKTSSSSPPRYTGLLSVDPSVKSSPRVDIDSKMVPAVAILLLGTLKRVFPTLKRVV